MARPKSSFRLFIEDCPRERGQDSPPQQLIYYCRIVIRRGERHLDIDGVRNAITGNYYDLALDQDKLPPLSRVEAANALHDWTTTHTEVFSGRVSGKRSRR